jgi:hypothetical protein
MASARPKRASGDAGIARFIFVFAAVLLTLGRLTSGEAIAQSAGDESTSGPELVAGKEVAHWSGLPIWGEKEAREHGFELPLPLGVSGNVFSAKENFGIPELKLGGRGGRLLDVDSLVQVTNVKIQETAWTSRFDSWVFPFLNLYAIAGYVDGQADIGVRPAMLPCGPKLDIHLGFDGPTLGLGATLAAGFRPVKDRDTIVFGLADLNFTETFLGFSPLVASLDPVGVMVLSTRLGVRQRILENSSLGEVHVSLWGGAMYQGVQEVMTGRLGILDLDFHANVEAVNPWNTIVGGRVEIGKNFVLTVEVGIGDRQSVMLEATYRF